MYFRPFLLVLFALLFPFGAVAQSVIPPTTYPTGTPVVVSSASDLTTGTNPVVVPSGATVDFVSSSKITLGPGFRAFEGSSFHAAAGLLPQTIPLNTLGDVNLTDGQFALPTQTNMGLPIAYTFDNPGVVSGIDSSGNVILLGAGQVKITATQAGNGTFAPMSVSQIINVRPPGTAGGNANGFVTLVTFTTPSGAPSDFTCKVQQGDGTNWLSTTVHTSVKSSTYRDVTVATYTGAATTTTPVALSTYRYSDQTWGTEEITSATVGGFTTNYTYYNDASLKGNYRRLRSVTEPTGNWVAYQYSDDWDDRGQIKTEYHPFLDSPAGFSFFPSSGRVISYTYQLSWTGRKTRPLSREEKVNGTRVAYTTYAPADLPAGNGYWATEATAVTAYRDVSLSQTSTTSNFRADQGVAARGRPSYSIGADGTKTSFNDAVGTYDLGTHTFANPGTPNYFRTLAAHGSSTKIDDTAIRVTKFDNNTLLDEQQLSTIWMTPNKSTLDICIYDMANHKLREETQIFRGENNFSLVSWTEYTYDKAGRVLTTTSSNGSTSNTYKNGLLISSTDALGQTLTYTYDIVGRPLSVTKKGVSGQSYDLVTINTYDGAGRVTKTVAGGLLTASKEYDQAGRVISSTVPGGAAGYTTTYLYEFGGRKVTVTPPSPGVTVITESYPDGSPKSVTGTGVISQTFSHELENTTAGAAFSRMKHTSYSGGVASSATVIYADMMGSPVEQHSPGYMGTDIVQTSVYNSKGQVERTTQTGAPDTLFEYDGSGHVKRQGSHIDGGATSLTLASNDRITEQDSYFSTPDSGTTWFATTTQSVYAEGGSGTAKVVSKTETQLNNFTGGTIAKSTVTDIYGNQTVSTTTLDKAARTVTTTTKASDSNTDAVSISINGLLQSSTDTSGIKTSYGYDTLGRQTTVTDAQYRTVTTAYKPYSSEIATVTDAANVVQQAYTYDGAGRVIEVAVPNPYYGIGTDTRATLSTRYGYDLMGRKIHEWGDNTTPVEIEYDDRGRQWKMYTYAKDTGHDFTASSWPTNPTVTATTTWDYHSNTSLLISKKDDQNHTVSFDYTAQNKLWHKTNARSQIITYDYYPTTGELKKESYSDLTTSIEYEYNRLGQIKGVNDAAGTRTLTYNTIVDASHTGTLELERQDFTVGDFASQRITYGIDTATVGAKGRATGIDFGISGATGQHQSVTYGYQADGRLSTVKSGATYQYTYTYKADSPLIEKGTLGNYTDTRGYETQHDWSKSRATTFGTGPTPTNLASFTHTLDLTGRIMSTAKTGALFNAYDPALGGLKTSYAYSDRGEVTGEKTFVTTTGLALPGRDNSGTATSPGFDYDKMGNRKTTNHNLFETVYTTNSLNQYTNVAVPGVVDVSRFNSLPIGSITVSGALGGQSTPASAKADDYFFNSYLLDNAVAQATKGVFTTLTVNDGSPSTNAYLPLRSFTTLYDSDGNMTDDGKWLYTYNLKNELVSVETSAAAPANAPKKKFSYLYDYIGRRVKKLTYDYSGGSYVANPAKEERYLYNGWNLAVVLNSSNNRLKSFVWGLDLSGSAQGAGGVGGLLMVQDSLYTGTVFLPAYDPNGNLHGLVTLNNVTISGLFAPAGGLVANYEYDAFGQTVREDGAYAGSNPFRYSTKYTDVETGLIYYGLRYYSPKLGRFINTDPIEEAGGVNLYAFCGNNGVNGSDYLGMGPWDDVPSAYVSLYYPGSFDPTSTNAYRDFLAYANSGFGSSGSGSFSFSFSTGGYLPNYYLPSTARSGGTVFVAPATPHDYGTPTQAPPDPAGVGNRTNTAQQRAIATNTGSTNVAGGVNAPNSGASRWGRAGDFPMMSDGINLGMTIGDFTDQVEFDVGVWRNRNRVFGTGPAIIIYATGIGDLAEGIEGFSVGEQRTLSTGERVLHGVSGGVQVVMVVLPVKGAAGRILAVRVPEGLSLRQFSQIAGMLRSRLASISDDIVIQGSRASGRATATSDIDIAVRVSREQFDKLIVESFGKPNPGSALERTMKHAIETGKIQAGEAGLRELRREIQKAIGIETDLSIILKDGPFDNGPTIAVPGGKR